jgi:small subunit ribosomal protein S21
LKTLRNAKIHGPDVVGAASCFWSTAKIPQFVYLLLECGVNLPVCMTEIRLKKGEPVEKAIRRLKKKLDREQTLQQFRIRRRFEKPSARKRRKMKAARFSAMLKARYAED